jgi:hypothetical protein
MSRKKADPRLTRVTEPSKLKLVVTDWGYVEPATSAPSFVTEQLLRLAGGEPDSFWADAFVGEGLYGNYLALHAKAETREGTLEITKLEVRPGVDHPEGGLVTDDLRLLRVNELARKLLAKITSGDESDWGPSPIGNPPMPPPGWATTLAMRPGRRGRDDLDYARVAAQYVALLHSQTPLKQLAEELRFNAKQVRNLLRKARDRGLLTEAPTGKAGGTLTPYALELLRADGNVDDG